MFLNSHSLSVKSKLYVSLVLLYIGSKIILVPTFQHLINEVCGEQSVNWGEQKYIEGVLDTTSN